MFLSYACIMPIITSRVKFCGKQYLWLSHWTDFSHKFITTGLQQIQFNIYLFFFLNFSFKFSIIPMSNCFSPMCSNKRQHYIHPNKITYSTLLMDNNTQSILQKSETFYFTLISSMPLTL